MIEEYELEEFANDAVSDLRKYIDTEKQLVKRKHEFLLKLDVCDYILGHLDERIPENMPHLHELSQNIAEKLVGIRGLIKSEILPNIGLIKEEEQTLQQLSWNVEHRNWRAVKAGIHDEPIKEKGSIRLEKEQLKEFHSRFIELMKFMKRSKLIKAIDEDLTIPKKKEEYEDLVEYYFLQIYKFLRAYERIFRHLWRKSRRLSKKVRREAKKIE